MITMRVLGTLLGCMFLNLNMTTCQSPGEKEKSPSPQPAEAPKKIQLARVDTSELTDREQVQWSRHVTELLAPCKDTPVNVAECVQTKRDCAACVPAAKFLMRQVRQGMTKGQVEAAFEARFSPDAVHDIDVAGSPIKGNPDAPITIVEWADFECPACRAASSTLSELVKKNQNVRLVFKNYPLDIHPNAEKAARAAMAAHRQDKFWEMHDALFSADPPLTKERMEQLAKSIGLDMKQFDQDLRSEEVADAVARDRKQGEVVRLRATPTLFINGRQFHHGTDLGAELDEWVALEQEMLDDKGEQGAP